MGGNYYAGQLFWNIIYIFVYLFEISICLWVNTNEMIVYIYIANISKFFRECLKQEVKVEMRHKKLVIKKKTKRIIFVLLILFILFFSRLFLCFFLLFIFNSCFNLNIRNRFFVCFLKILILIILIWIWIITIIIIEF